MNRKKPSFSALVRKLDRIFSQWVRLSNADNCGTVSCFTCEKPIFWKDAHAGHFIKRQHMAVRFDERNVKPQCPRCNVYMGGQQDEFAAKLITEYGVGEVEDLMRLKHSTVKWTHEELANRIGHYKKLLEHMNSEGLE